VTAGQGDNHPSSRWPAAQSRTLLAMASLEEVRARLVEEGYSNIGEDTKPNGQTMLWVPEIDAVINVWETGTCTVQGNESVKMQQVLGVLVGKGKGNRRHVARPIPTASSGTPSAAPAGSRKVFVVYGHDGTAKDQLTAMLQKWGLEPLVLDDLPSGGNTIIEKLEHYQKDVEWGVVLLTPDDIGHPALKPADAKPRARQNVVLEMGMLLGKLGRSRVTILYKDDGDDLELPSDINGYVYLPFKGHVRDANQALAKEMSDAGFFEVPVGRL
jgi:predicted nucleotide-binding protein